MQVPKHAASLRNRFVRLRSAVLTCLVVSCAPGSAAWGADDVWPAGLIAAPASVESVLVADAGNATLYWYRRDADGAFTQTEYYMSIGVRGMGKERRGDRRTPLGVYFVTEQLDTSRLHDKYGITAFPLDYPNEMDRQLGRTGDGIWLHGVQPGGERRPEFDTDGCIALPNDSLEELEPHLQPEKTPVIVTRSVAAMAAADRALLAKELRQALNAWRDAQRRGDITGYLAAYAEDFTYRGLDREQFAALRHRRLSRDRLISLEVDDVVLAADPEIAGMYLARFRLDYETESERRFRASKRLYWKRDAEGRLRIVGEDNG